MTQSSSQLTASVIIPTYNRSLLLDYTLHSLTRQTLDPGRFEVLVADDGSSDNTRQVADKYRDRLNLHYCYQEDKGYCPGSARNMGIANASGEVCIFVDSGVILGSNCLAQHLQSHAKASSPVAVIGYVYGFDQENAYGEEIRQLIAWQDPDASIRRFQLVNRFFDIREPHYGKYNNRIELLPAPWIFFWTCNVSARRRDLMEVGLFDENYDGIWGCEDNDLGYRLHESSVRIILNREADAIHYPHQKNAEEKFKDTQQNRAYFHRKFNSFATSVFFSAGEECTDLNDRLLEAEMRL